MSEIHNRTSQTVYLDVYGGQADDVPTATLTGVDGTTRSLAVTNDTPPAGVDERYHVVLNMADTMNDGPVSVKWEFSLGGVEVNKTDYFEIVTPLLSFSEIKEIHPNATESEVVRIEAAVRHIIQSLTGQTFGEFTGTKQVRGNGGLALYLPARLQEIIDVDGNENAVNYYSIEGDGYFLRHFPWGVPPVKADFYGLHQHTGGVIHNPNGVRLGEFRDSKTYEINGVWGWKSVPVPVKEAAKLLVNDYACGDAQYRDRYLTSMTAADWRIQFHSGAFRETGNVRADQLLNEYILKRGWAVI